MVDPEIGAYPNEKSHTHILAADGICTLCDWYRGLQDTPKEVTPNG